MNKYIIILILLYALKGMAEEPRKIVIRGDQAFPPYEFINEKGEADGFNIDLVRVIMESLKLPYDLQLGDWTEVLPLLEDQQVDLITGIAKSEERQGKFKFSKVHSYVNYIIVCRKNAVIQNPGELAHKNIIVQKYAVPYERLKSMHYDRKLLVVDDMVEGLKMLSAGEGDVAICPDNMAKYIIYKDGLTNLNIIDAHWPLREYCFAANDARLLARINAELVKLKKNGVYNRIHAKWLETEPEFEVPVWVYFLMGALALAAVLLYIFVRIYKRKIKKGELLLQAENKKLNVLLAENKDLINRYSMVFNTTLVGLSYYDKAGILVNINDEMIKLFGMDEQKKLLQAQLSVYRNPILRNYHIIDDNNQINEFHGIIRYDRCNKGDAGDTVRTDSGEEISYLKVDVMPIRDMNGGLEGLLITAADQTTEINYERQMLEEETKLSLALEAGSLGAWIYDPQKQVFNTLRGDTIAGKGLSMEENLEILHPEEREMQKQLLSELADGKKEAANMMLRYKHEDGTYHHYESRMIVKKEGQKVVAILGTQKDITDEVVHNKLLNDTVEKLRFAIQTANIALWVYDCQKRIFTSYNDPIADYQDEAPITMSTYDSYFQKDGTNWEQLENATRIMKNGEDESYIISVKLQTKYDREWQYCNIRGVPFEKDKSGKVTKYLGVRVNVTDQVKYQKVLEQEKVAAQQADKLKSMFLANMSHEIRTPLNAIVGFSELLQTTEEPETRGEFINIIHQNNELLLRLINDILDLSKIESGFIELKPAFFDLSEVFEETYAALKPRYTNPGVEFLKCNPYSKCRVRLDKNRLMQVLTNFVTNAGKQTSRGHIRMGYEYKDGGVRIYVEDTGCGISQEKQKKLFQRFAKLDDFTQGTGLGLAISKAITDAQQGRIGADSEEGRGSTFWAWFPCEAEIE